MGVTARLEPRPSWVNSRQSERWQRCVARRAVVPRSAFRGRRLNLETPPAKACYAQVRFGSSAGGRRVHAAVRTNPALRSGRRGIIDDAVAIDREIDHAVGGLKKDL